MAINWIESKVIDQTHWTDELVSIKFENKIPAYTAGQFTKIGLKLDGEIISRPYSLVSAPHEDFLEVIYVSVPDGKLTPHLQKLKKDDLIYVMDKSSGFFVMGEVPNGDKLWLIQQSMPPIFMVLFGMLLGLQIILLGAIKNPIRWTQQISVKHCMNVRWISTRARI